VQIHAHAKVKISFAVARHYCPQVKDGDMRGTLRLGKDFLTISWIGYISLQFDDNVGGCFDFGLEYWWKGNVGKD
jgi:hypothetical protein